MQAISLRLPDQLFSELVLRAKASAKSQTEIVRAALANYFQTSAAPVKPQSMAEKAAKWAGKFEAPADLSTNPKYMEDFGK